IFGSLTFCVPCGDAATAYPRHGEFDTVAMRAAGGSLSPRTGRRETHTTRIEARPCENLGSHAGRFVVLSTQKREERVTKALEKTYDGIIIGAGHHGLILGSYLAKAGLNILLVDRRLQYGGGLSTKEVTAPGFYHNLHSINHFHISETPWFKDLNLGERVTYITPRYELGQPHLDGSALALG